MTPTARRMLSFGVMAAFLAVIVIALVPGDGPQTVDDRVREIASNIKCPACNGASIADAQSSVARDLLGVIRDQVEAGLSDADIYDYFVARYSEAALLSPPGRGWGLWLWVLPLAALALGVAVVLGRRRGGPGTAPSSAHAVSEALDAVTRDLADLDDQLRVGELDESTVRRLRATYEAEAAALEARLGDADAPSGESAGATTARSNRRVVAGAAVLGVAMIAVGLSVGLAIRDREPGGPITGDVVQSAAAAGVVSLEDVTNEEMEAVVAQFPDNVPMRRALARRYFFAGSLDRAFDHYMAVLDRERDAEALANVGWITYLGSDEVEIALSLVEQSLAVEPENPMAYWFLANIRLDGLDDPAGAIAPLERFLAYPDVPDELRREAESLLSRAEQAA